MSLCFGFLVTRVQPLSSLVGLTGVGSGSVDIRVRDRSSAMLHIASVLVSIMGASGELAVGF